MPCFMTGSAAGDAKLAYNDLLMRSQASTRAACEMADYIRRVGKLSDLSVETRMWVVEHMKVDDGLPGSVVE